MRRYRVRATVTLEVERWVYAENETRAAIVAEEQGGSGEENIIEQSGFDVIEVTPDAK